jgi:hypothetical protein
MSDGPDFICIGEPKAGSGWLYDQLDDHPDFWMPPVKEIVYLGQRPPKLPFVKRKTTPDDSGNERLLRRETLDARDQAFIEHARACRGKPVDLDLYAGLFAPKGALLSGDVSPPYWTLRPKLIEAVAARFPHTKLVLLAREPVARAWSRISMAWRSELFDARLLDDADGFRDWIRANRKIGELFGTEIAARFRRHAPGLALGWVLFDDIADRPDEARREVLTFLGADPRKPGKGLTPDYNRKSEEQKLDMTETARAVLIEHFADELRASGALFGGAAKSWVGKYGI